MLRVNYFEVPKPKTFLYFLDLQKGTELIIFFSILNKASDSFFNTSLWKIFMYFYSLFALFGSTMMIKYIRTESPFHLLIYAYFYFIDTFVSLMYSSVFIILWLMSILKNAIISPGIGKTINHFRKSEIFKAWHHSRSGYIYDASLMSFSMERIFTILILCFFLCFKIYFCLVVFSCARHLILRTGDIYIHNKWIRKLISVLTYGKYWEKIDTSHEAKCSLELKENDSELTNDFFYGNRI
ncbi:hypothetical protein PORY_001175 [Pneumocystis oryctolagi]|uniref:Uncharacterized protein n=1 Tax=Pneumocystis oryctolagi TaxID=42067 RepID=A0ACB7CCY8_9ASCO|nr:hypothetical protein PORY_001175 [Pneumocystis oryctolagi]